MPKKDSNASSVSTLHAVPDAGSATSQRHTGAEDKLWHAVHANPGSTAAELADHAAIGRSTAGKILATWAADGSLTRISGIGRGGRRAADTWTINDAIGDDEPPTDVPEDAAPVSDSATGAPEQAEPTPANEPVLSRAEPLSESIVDDEDVGEGGVEEAQEPGTAPVGSPIKSARLGKGALRGMVEDFLAERPGEQFGPGSIANALHRSSGAVANALDKLVAAGYATKVQDAPKRYTAKPAS